MALSATSSGVSPSTWQSNSWVNFKMKFFQIVANMEFFFRVVANSFSSASL